MNEIDLSNPNQALAKLSESRDLSKLEEFPGVLAWALERHPDELDLVRAQNHLHSGPEGLTRYRRLVALSLRIFQDCGFPGLMPESRVDGFGWDAFAGPVKVGERELDGERAKANFMRAFVQEGTRREEPLAVLFSTRQRELLGKKLRGAPMTKTEREYFSRVIKKRLQALADPGVQRLAGKILGR